MKQNGVPFLLSLAKEYSGEFLVELLEIVWSMSFSSKAADLIRADEDFKKRVEEMSKTTTDEALKKASQGLVWKLIQGIRNKKYILEIVNIYVSVFRASIFGKNSKTKRRRQEKRRGGN